MRHRVTPEIVDFAARDGFGLNFHHYPSIGSGNIGPVIVFHGAGVRANPLFPATDEPSSTHCIIPATISGVLTKAWAINPAS
jgi:hypothetical protein